MEYISLIHKDFIFTILFLQMQVNYRESISKVADVRYVHKKQSGGSGQFADVAIRFEPSEPGAGFVFKSDIKGGTVPKEYIPGVVKVSPSLLDSSIAISQTTNTDNLGMSLLVGLRWLSGYRAMQLECLLHCVLCRIRHDSQCIMLCSVCCL